MLKLNLLNFDGMKPSILENEILVTCFIQILQCRATDSPMSALTRLLFTELSSNLGSTVLAAATGSLCLTSSSPPSADPIIAAVVWTADIFGPIMGSIRPEILRVWYQLWFIDTSHFKPYTTNISLDKETIWTDWDWSKGLKCPGMWRDVILTLVRHSVSSLHGTAQYSIEGLSVKHEYIIVNWGYWL